MRAFPEKLPVCILGAGPAGLCVALRLLEMGHEVGMIEAERFPRSQIGESLSPAIRPIFDYLGAGNILEHELFLYHLPSRVIWESREPVYKHPKNQPGNIIVDRAILDQHLLELALQRGLHLLQPATMSRMQRTEAGWNLEISSEGTKRTIQTQLVLDARGRKGTLTKDRFAVSPPSVAIWTHVDSKLMPEETFVEAIEEGWFWGAKVSGNKYRIMAFTDGKTIREHGIDYFHELAEKTNFFAPVAEHLEKSTQETCSVTEFVHQNPWNDAWIKLGEAAFTLDPLSSSGVEKAMRFSLQAAIAINTWLKNPESTHPKDFYEEKLIETVSNHTRWTASFYRESWAYEKGASFWKNKSEFQLSIPPDASAFLQRFQKQVYSSAGNNRKAPVHLPVDLILNQIRWSTISPSPLITFREKFAVVNDLVEVIQAVCHPQLEQPVGYLEQLHLGSLLQELKGQTIETAVASLSRKIPLERAKKVILHLWQSQLITLE